MKTNTSSTGPTERHLMSPVERIVKDKQLLSMENTPEPIRDGMFSILTRPRRFQERDLTQNSDSIEIDHSTLDQDFQ